MNYSEKVTNILIEQNISISFMESCTAGLLASILTDTEGASAIFKGSDVTYSNEAKISAGVDEKIIKKYGVYSLECAEAMAFAIKNKYKSDIAVGITGSTGNIDPNNKDSSEGEAYFCIIFNDKPHNYQINLDVSDMNRKEIKLKYADLVYKSIDELLH